MDGYGLERRGDGVESFDEEALCHKKNFYCNILRTLPNFICPLNIWEGES